MAISEQEKISTKKAILVVEDDQFLVKLYQHQIEKEGVDVWVATDGEQALSFLSKKSPDVVILDLMLPGMSGFDVLTAMRANKLWQNVPVLIVSNLGQEQDIKRAEELGVKDYIIKANMHLKDIAERAKKYL